MVQVCPTSYSPTYIRVAVSSSVAKLVNFSTTVVGREEVIVSTRLKTNMLMDLVYVLLSEGNLEQIDTPVLYIFRYTMVQLHYNSTVEKFRLIICFYCIPAVRSIIHLKYSEYIHKELCHPLSVVIN